MNLYGKKNYIKNIFKYLGPAFIISVAYVDPGNFATNITGGSLFNYDLLWVILASNLMAIFLQINSAKLGIATGKNLPEMCREEFTKKTNVLLWVFAELAAIATTMAEFLGGALGLYLLFRISLPIAGLLTCIITFMIVSMQKYGQKVIEIIITVFVAIICIGYGVEMFLAEPDWIEVGIHSIMPSIPNSEALLIAVGMLGATVMPHVIFLHSQLVQSRNKTNDVNEKRRHLKMEKIDIAIAMNIAFLVNASMLIVSASVFYTQGLVVDSIELAHQSLEPLLGILSSTAFGIALLASGFSSSVVGTMAGESVMDGFINVKISSNWKRFITMVPALLVILSGVNPMQALIFSQVSLSFILPMAVIPLLIITSKKEVMGVFTNTRVVKTLGIIITTLIIILNIFLIIKAFV
ncbi:MAG: Nramp family divalent metal transporter [Bacilli bacterium]|nr:Nramp family divalent metal transporter [Bacilli bacterium]MDD4053346.1 Nramp family divalent metal transporter [Bacilli bacterium]MDD4411007.1 Nramp family divalent metal transporter [Bacilli bacterium]